MALVRSVGFDWYSWSKSFLPSLGSRWLSAITVWKAVLRAVESPALSNARSRKKGSNSHPLWLPWCLGDFPQLAGAASKLMVILCFVTSQERPELVVPSELLVPASEPSTKREQRPCDFE